MATPAGQWRRWQRWRQRCGGNGGGSNGGSGSSGGGSLLADTAGLVAAVPGALAHGSLAFTGANPLLTGLLGIGLAGAGAFMLRAAAFRVQGLSAPPGAECA